MKRRKGKKVCVLDVKSNMAVEKPSIKERNETRRKAFKELQEWEKNRYSEQQLEQAQYGVYWKRGYVSIKIFPTLEEAQAYLDLQRSKDRMEIREILKV